MGELALLERLRQRKLVQWALAYLAGAWLLLQVLDLFSDAFGWSVSIQQIAIVLLGIGFFAALVLAWYHGEKGHQRVSGPELLMLTALLGIAGAAVTWVRTEPPRSPQNHPSPAPALPALSARQGSIAVLPLKNYSGDPAQEYFADGMTEELITTLTKIKALRVIAHQSVLQFKQSQQPVPEIARLLGVKFVMAGSVLQDGERVRITANLIDAATNTPVWGERFEQERRDVLALQREVALAIARQIEITLTPEDRARLADAPQVNPEAFDLYLKGTQTRYKQTPKAWAEAKNYFEQAIAKDSSYAPAYAGLGNVHFFSQDPAEARRLAKRAIALNPNLAEPHIVLGLILQTYDWDWAGAEQSFRQAISLDPGHAEAHHELSMLLMRRKRFSEALQEARHTLYLAPTSARFQAGLGEVFFYSGQYAEAVAAADKALVLDPSFSQAHGVRGLAYGQQRKYDEAVEAWNTCMRVTPACTDWAQANVGYIYAVSGRREEALQLLSTLTARWRDQRAAFIPYGIAQIYAGLGDREQALDWLERTIEPVTMSYLAIDPTLRSLHSEPRFQALLQKIGLSP